MIDIVQEELRLIELFREKAADKRLELAMRTADQVDEDHKRRHERKLRQEEEERKLEEAIATVAQLATFNEHLDDYDTATVHALMNNQTALDLIFKQREEIEAAAFRLPDGRMAFKTEDRRHVFDQHGTELGPETIHPDAIPDSAPTWERDQKIAMEADKLVHERDQLHAYQDRVDEAREAAGKGNITADALARMEVGLQKDMPDAVRAQLPGAAPKRDFPSLGAVSPASLELPRTLLPAYAPAGP